MIKKHGKPLFEGEYKYCQPMKEREGIDQEILFRIGKNKIWDVPIEDPAEVEEVPIREHNLERDIVQQRKHNGKRIALTAEEILYIQEQYSFKEAG